MTVIAWDGSSLAADKRIVFGGLVRTVTKIESYNGELIGSSGGVAAAQELLHWYKKRGSA